MQQFFKNSHGIKYSTKVDMPLNKGTKPNFIESNNLEFITFLSKINNKQNTILLN